MIRSLRILIVALGFILAVLAFFSGNYNFIGLGFGSVVGVLAGWYWLGLAFADINTVPYIAIAVVTVILCFLLGFLGFPEPVASFLYVLGIVTALQMFVRRYGIRQDLSG